MKKFILIASALMLSITALAGNHYRYIHNCDGTDLLGNFENSNRPLTLDDLNAYVDRLCKEGVTTLMCCSGSDFPNYRSKYGRMMGDDLGGTLPTNGDTSSLKYLRNFKTLEAAGTDYLRAFMTRTKENGKESFITYRMNDLHSCDPAILHTIHASDFWGSHPEYWVGDEGHGWHREAALNFAFPEVRQLKYNMIAEQIEKYGDVMDGFEMDFCRFVVYFPLGQGWANKEKMTALVRDVKAKVDEVSRANGHKILLTVRVPDTWISCMDNGMDVSEWAKEGLIDFITLGVHWKGDPAIDCDSFRKEAGISKKVPMYFTLDDGSFWPREFYTEGELRGAVSFALNHGADGTYLFNYFFKEETLKTGLPVSENGIISYTICPSIMSDLCTAEAVDGRNKTYSYYSGNAEYGLSYKSKMPLHPGVGCDDGIAFFIGDKMKTSVPQQAYLFYRTTKGSALRIKFNGSELQHSPADADLTVKHGKNGKLTENEEAGCFIVPAGLLKHGSNDVVVSSDAVGVTVTKMELTLDYGDVTEYGYF